MTFGKALKNWMATTNRTVQMVADEAGISSVSVYNLLKEVNEPRRATIALICAVFGCNETRFLHGPEADKQEAALLEDVGTRICKICYSHKDSSCKLCRLHQCARAIQLISDGMDIDTAVKQSEEEVTQGLKSITAKYDRVHDLQGA